MNLRIAIWAAAGALIVAFWGFYFSATHSDSAWLGWTLVDLTCPIALARQHAMTVYVVLLVNATTHALGGMVAETVWRHPAYLPTSL